MYNCRLQSLRGYSHQLKNSIISCPQLADGGIIMPLANSLQLFDGERASLVAQTQRNIAAIDMQGKTIVVGESASPGQLISAVVFNTDSPQNPKVFNYQKTEIRHIGLSCDGEFFCSVGCSSEDLQELNVIEVNNQSEVGTKIFYSKLFKKKGGVIKGIRFAHHDPHFFVVLRETEVLYFRIDLQTQNVHQQGVATSRVRQYNSIIFHPNDRYLYGCSKNGDIAEISVEEGRQTRIGPRKRVITKGITNIRMMGQYHLLISGKEGLLAVVALQDMRLLKEVKVPDDEIVSISEVFSGSVFVATSKATIYKLNTHTFQTQLYYNCHSTAINDLAALPDYSGIFGTCSGGDIIIWKSSSLCPLLKISLPKLTCNSLCFPKNGRRILSGWKDDAIRVFAAKNGSLIKRIEGCNLGRVVEIAQDEVGCQMVCGGSNGIIRMWSMAQKTAMDLVITGSLVHHTRQVNCLKISPFNPDLLISCCEDGCYGVWHLRKLDLMRVVRMGNYLKEVYFVDDKVIRLCGDSNKVVECFLADGKIKQQYDVSGTYLTTITDSQIAQTEEHLLLYGSDCSSLNYFDLTDHTRTILSINAYGPIVKMQLLANETTLIAVTQNGVILSYHIFSRHLKESKNEDQEDEQITSNVII